MEYFDGPKPRLFAHRGSSGTHPENTLEAFRAGLEAGAERLELDIHASSDGVLVVAHDETLDRMTSGRGPVAALSYEELRQLDAGVGFVDESGARPFAGGSIRIPSLEQVLAEFPGVPLNIEIKQVKPAIEQAVLDLLDRFNARQQVVVASHDPRPMERIRELAPDLHSGMSAAEVATFVSLHQSSVFESYRPQSAVMQIPVAHEGIELATAAMVDAAHRLGLEVHVWTINDPEEVRDLLELGVDGIMSDYPAMAYKVFQDLGFR